MLTVTTTEGKQITFSEAYIQIEKNHLIKGGLYFALKISGKLPGCRKNEVFTTSFVRGKIVITTLFNYRKWHLVEPTELLAFLKQLPVVAGGRTTDRWKATDEQVALAREYVEGMCHCEAVTNYDEKTGWYTK